MFGFGALLYWLPDIIRTGTEAKYEYWHNTNEEKTEGRCHRCLEDPPPHLDKVGRSPYSIPIWM